MVELGKSNNIKLRNTNYINFIRFLFIDSIISNQVIGQIAAPCKSETGQPTISVVFGSDSRIMRILAREAYGSKGTRTMPEI